MDVLKCLPAPPYSDLRVASAQEKEQQPEPGSIEPERVAVGAQGGRADHGSHSSHGVELGGRTPDEAYRGDELGLAERLRREHAEARVRRVAENRARTCASCELAQHAPPTPTLSLVP